MLIETSEQLRHCMAGKCVWTQNAGSFLLHVQIVLALSERAGSGPNVGQALIPQQAHLAKAGAQAATEPDV